MRPLAGPACAPSSGAPRRQASDFPPTPGRRRSTAWCATLETLGRDLEALGCEVRYATPKGRLTVPLPTYPEIRLAMFPRRSLERMIDEFAPDAIHIATEGTIGLSARAICRARGLSFTTSFHTRFPVNMLHARFPFVPKQFVYRILRWFPRAGNGHDGRDAPP